LKSIFTPLPLPRGCHATRDMAGWGEMKRDPDSGASLRCRIARWLTISACAGKGSNPFSRSIVSRSDAPSSTTSTPPRSATGAR
jgi:hypothetical protein